MYGYKTVFFNQKSRSAMHRVLTFKKVIFLNKSYDTLKSYQLFNVIYFFYL